MIKLNRYQVKILKELFSTKNRKLEMFTLFKRMKLPFSEIIKSLNYLHETNLIIREDLSVILSDDGIQYILSSKKYLIQFSDFEWKKVPVSFSQAQMLPNEFYIPNLSIIDKTLRKTVVQ